jgi:hypothetical protein
MNKVNAAATADKPARKTEKPDKPYPEFPLFAHDNGR